MPSESAWRTRTTESGKSRSKSGSHRSWWTTRGDPGEEVLPRARQQCLAPRRLPPDLDAAAVPELDIPRPVPRAPIGRPAETAIMVAMEMIMRVDQARPDLAVRKRRLEIERPVRLDDPPILDAERRDCAAEISMRISAVPPKRQSEDDRQAVIRCIEQRTAPDFVVKTYTSGPIAASRTATKRQARQPGCGEMVGEFMDMMLDFMDLATDGERSGDARPPSAVGWKSVTITCAPASATRASSRIGRNAVGQDDRPPAGTRPRRSCGQRAEARGRRPTISRDRWVAPHRAQASIEHLRAEIDPHRPGRAGAAQPPAGATAGVEQA